MLTIIIPLRNEYDNLGEIVNLVNAKLKDINFELLFINDYSTDKTFEKGELISKQDSRYKIYDNKKRGLGGAINLGIKKSSGEFVSIMMADLSDDVEDLVKYYNIIKKENLDAVLGSRFIKGSKIEDYPFNKLFLNRIFNYAVKIFFFSDYNDFTNAFKIYKKSSLTSILPLVSESFNIFLEIPLKIISRNYKYKIIPISWKNRKKGKAKFKINELRSKYLFTFLYCLLEKILLKKQ